MTSDRPEISNLHLARDLIWVLERQSLILALYCPKSYCTDACVAAGRLALLSLVRRRSLGVRQDAQGKGRAALMCDRLLPWLLLSFLTHVPKTTYLTFSKSVYSRVSTVGCDSRPTLSDRITPRVVAG